jgi:hypothetical protein
MTALAFTGFSIAFPDDGAGKDGEPQSTVGTESITVVLLAIVGRSFS